MVCVAAAAINTHEHSSVLSCLSCLSCLSAQVQSADVLPRAAPGTLGHALRVMALQGLPALPLWSCCSLKSQRKGTALTHRSVTTRLTHTQGG